MGVIGGDNNACQTVCLLSQQASGWMSKHVKLIWRSYVKGMENTDHVTSNRQRLNNILLNATLVSIIRKGVSKTSLTYPITNVDYNINNVPMWSLRDFESVVFVFVLFSFFYYIRWLSKSNIWKSLVYVSQI